MSGTDHSEPTADLDHRIHVAERALFETLGQIAEKLNVGADVILLCHSLARQQEVLALLLAEKDDLRHT